MTAKALMVLGTTSDAGKSLTNAALCRIFRQDGFNVAPFKAQNMALNSFPTREGHEIGRAQAAQAQAAGLEPHVDMNPILLKPSSDVGSQVILNGKVLGNYKALAYEELKAKLIEAVESSYDWLAARHELIVLEGAGSPVEMNLKANDLVNLRMAQYADARCVLVTDIDRGGIFAQLIGTYELLTSEERARFAGFIVNKFRGDVTLLHPGIDYLEQRLGQPCLGVVPYFHNHGIDDEDSVSVSRRAVRPDSRGDAALKIGVVSYPYMSNFTDFTALEAVEGVTLFYTRTLAEGLKADVLVLPGSKNTLKDLAWLRETGWDELVRTHARAGKPVVGICGGFQMLGKEVRDPLGVEGPPATARGLELLDVSTEMAGEKITRQAAGLFFKPAAFLVESFETPLEGYEIHMGRTDLGNGVTPFLKLNRMDETGWFEDGAMNANGSVFGTYLHGLFDAPDARAVLVKHVGRLAGKPFPDDLDYRRLPTPDERFDALADHFRSALNMVEIHRSLGLQPRK